MTRQKALLAGETTYFTGKSCKNGHISERYVANWTCVVCHYEKHAKYLVEWRKKNPEKVQEYSEKYAQIHNESTKLWRQKNQAHCNQTQRDWNVKNREKRNLLSKEWRKRNPELMATLKAKRRADILCRTPKWLTKNEMWMIEETYRLANLRTLMTGIDWHVDHVIPLRGKFVSGLHTPYNLQVIPAFENLKKGNLYGH
jgi:hypothetical protein